TKIEYAIDRYAMETKRQLDVLDKRLADRAYVGGEQYTIADMAIWPWYGQLVQGQLYAAAEFLAVDEYAHVQRWAEAVGDRAAVRRGVRVNRSSKTPGDGLLAERHDASDFGD